MDYSTKQIECIEQECEVINEDEYCEWLDSIDGPLKVCGMEFDASRILKELDPIAFNCGFSDYLDGDEFVEVNDEHYRQSDVDDALESNDLN